MDCKISIIIPAFNAEKYLSEAIDSVMKQKYGNYEVVIVVNGSSDKTYDIGKKYADKDKRIRLMKSEEANVSHARNMGLELATGEYILFLDADDMLFSNALEELGSIAKKGYDIVSFDFLEIKNDYVEKSSIEEMVNEIDINNIDIKVFQNLDNEICNYLSWRSKIKHVVWGNLYKRSLLKKMRFIEELYIGEDDCFQLETILKAQSIVYINRKYYLNRIYDNNSLSRRPVDLKSTKNIIKANEYKVAVVKKNNSRFLDNVMSYNFIHTFSWINRSIIERNDSVRILLEKELLRYWGNISNKALVPIKKKIEFGLYMKLRPLYCALLRFKL